MQDEMIEENANFEEGNSNNYQYADGTREIKWGCRKNRKYNFDPDFDSFN